MTQDNEHVQKLIAARDREVAPAKSPGRSCLSAKLILPRVHGAIIAHALPPPLPAAVVCRGTTRMFCRARQVVHGWLLRERRVKD